MELLTGLGAPTIPTGALLLGTVLTLVVGVLVVVLPLGFGTGGTTGVVTGVAGSRIPSMPIPGTVVEKA